MWSKMGMTLSHASTNLQRRVGRSGGTETSQGWMMAVFPAAFVAVPATGSVQLPLAPAGTLAFPLAKPTRIGEIATYSAVAMSSSTLIALNAVVRFGRNRDSFAAPVMDGCWLMNANEFQIPKMPRSPAQSTGCVSLTRRTSIWCGRIPCMDECK